ncbi:MAG: hypothetical protein FJX70_05455 [Alphaproteobacteria bacterium]|nr:hypothetical protein [Alphaproteobacteria bacterium]
MSINTLYKYLKAFKKFFPEDTLGISTFEVESKTIEAADDDIWYIEAYFLKQFYSIVLWTLIQSLSLSTLSKSFSTADKEPVGYEYSIILSININNIIDRTAKIDTINVIIYL